MGKISKKDQDPQAVMELPKNRIVDEKLGVKNCGCELVERAGGPHLKYSGEISHGPNGTRYGKVSCRHGNVWLRYLKKDTVVTLWERFHKATDKVPERWEFNHVELREVPIDQTHPTPTGSGPVFANQIKKFQSGKWRFSYGLRSPTGVIKVDPWKLFAARVMQNPTQLDPDELDSWLTSPDRLPVSDKFFIQFHTGGDNER